MRLPFLDPPPSHPFMTGPSRDTILQELCDQRQKLLLCTPYLNFEAHFLERKGQELHLRVMLGKEAVKHALTPNPLRIRFSWALSFYAGATHVLGYEQEENLRLLRVHVPETLERDDQRRAFRVQRVGLTTGTISSEGTSLRISLENLSITGAGVFVLEPLAPDLFRTARFADLALSLEQGPSLNLRGRICHVDGQSLGLAFHPAATERLLEQLAQWLDPREQEARHHWENRAELRAEQSIQSKEVPAGVLLLTSNSAIKDQVTHALKNIQPVRALSPTETRFQPPLMVLLDIGETSPEDLHRFRSLLETMALDTPLVILGNGRDREAAGRLATELKAATHLDWNPEQEVFICRLTRGLIHQRWKHEMQGD